MAIGTIKQKFQTISGEELDRIDNLTPRNMIDTLQKQCKFEVLVFYTQHEYDTTLREVDLKKKIFAKFRDYNAAEAYAQQLIMGNVHLYKVVIRA